MADNRSNQNLKAAVIVAILALFGANVYQFVNNRSLQTDNLSKESEIVELDKAKTELEKQYQESVVELNSMKTDNEELNKSIDAQKEELRLQKDKITLLLKDSKNLSAARKEMEGMKGKIQEYVTEINKLKEDNQQLVNSNTTLASEKENLTKTVEQKNAENRELAEAKTTLLTEKEKIDRDRAALSKKVNRTSVIQVEKIDGAGYQNRDGKKPSSKSKAKDVDFLEVCFKTTINPNTDAGNEKFYIRIINPVGETQAIESQGSGVFNNETTGEQIRYSTIATANYKNDEQKVCGKWESPGSFQKGVYQIEIYNKGYLVGTSTVKLK